jgi:uncharacterized membrane protein
MEISVTAVASAPPETVWRLFTDVERWPELNNNVTEVRRLGDGPLRVGSEAQIRQPGMPVARWRVTELDPGRSFTWETALRGLTAVGGHVVEPDAAGSVITITLGWRGPLAPVVATLLGRRARRSITLELESFRRGAEAEPG